MPQLDFTWFPSQLFWLAIVFSLIYLVIARLTLPKIEAIVSKREEVVNTNLSKAEKLKEAADKFDKEHETQISDAHAKASKVITKAKLKAAELRTAQEQKADKNLAEKLANAEKEISAKRQEAIKALNKEEIKICQLITGKIANFEPEPSKVSKILDKITVG